MCYYAIYDNIVTYKCSLYNIYQSTVYYEHCILCMLYTVVCMMLSDVNVYCKMYTVHCTAYSVQ